MQLHVKIIGCLTIALHCITLLTGLVIYLLFIGVGGAAAISAPHDGGIAGLAVLGGIGTLIMGIFLALSLPGIFIGWGLITGKEWARIGAIVLGVISLLHVPFGTALAVYTFVIMFDPQTISMFQRRTW